MSNAFDTMLATDALQHIKALGATQQTYTPRDATALTRWILVMQMQGEHVDGTLNAYAQRIEAWICKDATNGVATVTVGGDTISVTPRLGETAQTYVVADILDQDAGLWHLLLYGNG